MSDFLQKMVVAGVAAIATLLITLIGYKLKRRSDRLDALRKAYSQWFAAETVFTRRVKKLALDSNDALDGKKRHDVLMREIESLEEAIKPLIASINDTFLLEKKEVLRRKLSLLQERADLTFRLLQSTAGHYKEHIDMRSLREHLRGQLTDEKPKEAKIALQNAVDIITEWDQKCTSVSPQTIEDIVKLADELHRLSESLRDVIASKLRR